MATTSSKGKSTGSKGGSVSLAEEDRRYLTESMSTAKGRGAGEVDESSVFEALERFGLSSERVQRLRKAIADVDVRESVDKASEYLAEQINSAREYTKENPKKVLGGAAAGVLVGASLLALALRRAAGGEKKKKSSGSSKKSVPSSSSKKASPASTSSASKKSSPAASSTKKSSAASMKRRR